MDFSLTSSSAFVKSSLLPNSSQHELTASEDSTLDFGDGRDESTVSLPAEYQSGHGSRRASGSGVMSIADPATIRAKLKLLRANSGDTHSMLSAVASTAPNRARVLTAVEQNKGRPPAKASMDKAGAGKEPSRSIDHDEFASLEAELSMRSMSAARGTTASEPSGPSDAFPLPSAYPASVPHMGASGLYSKAQDRVTGSVSSLYRVRGGSEVEEAGARLNESVEVDLGLRPPRAAPAKQAQQVKPAYGHIPAEAEPYVPPAPTPSPQAVSDENSLASLVQAKVAALNEQIERYKVEVDKAKAAQKDAEAARTKAEIERAALVKERASVEEWRVSEQSRFEAVEREMRERVERQVRVALRQTKAHEKVASSLPERQERAELESLRAAVSRLKGDLQAADARYKTSLERHKATEAGLRALLEEHAATIAKYEAERVQMVFGPGGLSEQAPGVKGSTKAEATSTAALPPQPSAAQAAGAEPRGRPAAVATTAASLRSRRTSATPSVASHGMRSASSSGRPAVVPLAAPVPLPSSAQPPIAPPAQAAGMTDQQPVVQPEGIEAASGKDEQEQDSFLAALLGRPTLASTTPPPVGTASASSAPGPSLPALGRRIHTGKEVEDATGTSLSTGPHAGPVTAPSAPARLFQTRDTPVAPPAVSQAVALPPQAGGVAEQTEAGPRQDSQHADVVEAVAVLNDSSSTRRTAAFSSTAVSRVRPSLGGDMANLLRDTAPLSLLADAHTEQAGFMAGKEARRTSFAGSVSSTQQCTSVNSALPPLLDSHMRMRVNATHIGKGVQAAVMAGRVHLVEEQEMDGGKICRRYSNNTRVVRFKNGTEKETSADGVVIVRFSNGDVKRSYRGTQGQAEESYYYAAVGTVQTSYASSPCVMQAEAFLSGGCRSAEDATQCSLQNAQITHRAAEVYTFPTGQVEVHWQTMPDGTGARDKDILFADGGLRLVRYTTALLPGRAMSRAAATGVVLCDDIPPHVAGAEQAEGALPPAALR